MEPELMILVLPCKVLKTNQFVDGISSFVAHVFDPTGDHKLHWQKLPEHKVCMALAVKGWTVCRFHVPWGSAPGQATRQYRHGLDSAEEVTEGNGYALCCGIAKIWFRDRSDSDSRVLSLRLEFIPGEGGVNPPVGAPKLDKPNLNCFEER